jgi:tetratricopeptide (TPR) repeat protein
VTSARRLLLACLLVSLLPLHLASQTSPEQEAENAIEAAKLAQAKGDYAQAVAGYQAAVKLMPEVPELYSNLGIAYYYHKDYDQAIQALQQALKGKPGLEGANFFLGMAYVRTARFQQSIKPLEKALSLNPKIREAYINLSSSYVEIGRKEDALRVLDRAEKVFPDDVEILYSLGTLHYQLMFEIYGKMARLAPNSYRYDEVMGRSFEERQEFPGAIAEFQDAIKDNPRAPGLHYELGNVYWLQGHYPEARREFETELEISPEDYRSIWKIGNSYVQERQYDKALPYLQKAISEKPDLGGAIEDLGKLYVESNDGEHAIPYLNKVVQMDPTESTSHFLLSRAYRQMGKTDEARAEMELFEKLRQDENQRRMPPAAMFAGADHTGEKTQSSETPNPPNPQ